MLHGLRTLRGLGQIGGGERYQNFLQVLAGLDHSPEMRGGDLQTPRIGQGMPGFAAQNQKVGMPQRQHAFLAFLPFRPDDEFNVYRVGVADGDSGL